MPLVRFATSVSKTQAIAASFAVSSTATVVLYKVLQSTGDFALAIYVRFASLPLSYSNDPRAHVLLHLSWPLQIPVCRIAGSGLMVTFACLQLGAHDVRCSWHYVRCSWHRTGADQWCQTETISVDVIASSRRATDCADNFSPRSTRPKHPPQQRFAAESAGIALHHGTSICSAPYPRGCFFAL